MNRKRISLILVLVLIFSLTTGYSSVPDYHIRNGKVYDLKDNIVKNKIVKINSNKYYADKNGKVVKNKIFKYSNGNYYYAQKKGVLAASKMFTYKGNRYYASKKGYIITNKLFTYKNKRFYAQNKGALAKNKMVTYNDKKYYAGSKYELVKNKKVFIKGDYYYFGKKGILVTNRTISIDGEKYKADSEGRLTKVKNSTATTQTTTQENTTEDKNPSKTECCHKWVIDEKAYYEWTYLYDENGSIILHQLCPGCGYDLDEYAKEINNTDLYTLLKTHPCIANNIFSSCAENYVYYGKDEKGNWINHPHRGQSVGMDTYIPASYKCSECGAKLYYNYLGNTNLYNIHLLQKYGKEIDLSKLKWIYDKQKILYREGNHDVVENYDTDKKTITVVINGITITADNYHYEGADKTDLGNIEKWF